MRKLSQVLLFFFVIGVAVAVINTVVFAEETIPQAVEREMPVLKGDQWLTMDENSKVAFVWGAGHVVTIEEVIMEKYPDQQRDTFVTKIVEAASNSPMTMSQVVAMVELFKKYSGQYEFDWLMIAAQGYQESGLDQNKRSPAGAVGVMQLLPTTAKDPKVGIADIEKLESNIHAGTKYLRFMTDRYFDDPDIEPRDRMLFAFASYNAGPRKIAQMRELAERRGLDPNVWFRNVDMVVADKMGRETVTYVGNIYKYYVAYEMALEQTRKRKEIKECQAAK